MDDVGASSQSSLPQNNPDPQPEPNPEPPEPHPDPDLSHPLLDDNTRRAELDERAGFHFVELSEDKKGKVLNAQVQIERAIEKALLSDGYSRDELSQRNKRDEIRAFLFYPRGKLLSIKTYESYVKEVEFGTHRSQPYKRGYPQIRTRPVPEMGRGRRSGHVGLLRISINIGMRFERLSLVGGQVSIPV
ncbi:hypothetical protein VNO78_35113 [Psophocarpus tetragonolobus]|uniref:Uncharacterized protein n=1 Tax=Psophocarpus tetragonolobus TaxID=3891 RepID=A0AAN9NRS9_PSOTE